MSKKTDEEKELEKLLDDEMIREYFIGRDPNRKKVNPFLTAEAEEMVRGTPQPISTTGSEKTNRGPNYQTGGIPYAEHTKTMKNIARHFFFIGIIVALTLAILLQITF